MPSKEELSELGNESAQGQHREITVFLRLGQPLQRLRDLKNLHTYRRGGILGTEGLKWLVERYNLLDPKPEKIDGQSIDLHLGNEFARYKDGITIRYKGEAQEDPLVRFEIPDDGILTLKPQEAILGITKETIAIPQGFFGFIQSKERTCPWVNNGRVRYAILRRVLRQRSSTTC